MSANFPGGLLPDQKRMHDEASNAPGPPLHELPPVELRQVYIEIMKQVDAPARDVAVQKDLQIPGPAGPMLARLIDVRAERGPGPVVVLIHGGGWVMGGVNIITPFATELAHALDLPVVAIGCRLAPENKFPPPLRIAKRRSAGSLQAQLTSGVRRRAWSSPAKARAAS